MIFNLESRLKAYRKFQKGSVKPIAGMNAPKRQRNLNQSMNLQTLRLGVAMVPFIIGLFDSRFRTSIGDNGAIDDDPISLGTRDSDAAINVDRSLAGLARNLAVSISRLVIGLQFLNCKVD